MWIPIKQFVITAAILLFLVPVATGAEIEGVQFVDSVEADGSRLSIRGTGLFRYMVFIKAYVGALYMLDGVPSEDVLTDTPRRLEIEYFHSIEGEDFGAASNKIMSRNVEPGVFKDLKPRLDKLNALYRDVRPGDRYSLTYVPGKGTELALNQNPLGIVEGADFASAIFAMWLGDQPMNNSFKEQLLGSS